MWAQVDLPREWLNDGDSRGDRVGGIPAAIELASSAVASWVAVALCFTINSRASEAVLVEGRDFRGGGFALRRPYIPKVTPDARSWRSALEMNYVLVGYYHIKKCTVMTVPMTVMLPSFGIRV